MADFDVSAIGGDSRGFIARKFFSNSISVGSSGDILILPASAGKIYRLDAFFPSASGVSEDDIELYADGVLVNQTTTTTQRDGVKGNFSVRQGGGALFDVIQDVVASEIIIKKTSGSVVNELYYSYSEGV